VIVPSYRAHSSPAAGQPRTQHERSRLALMLRHPPMQAPCASSSATIHSTVSFRWTIQPSSSSSSLLFHSQLLPLMVKHHPAHTEPACTQTCRRHSTRRSCTARAMPRDAACLCGGGGWPTSNSKALNRDPLGATQTIMMVSLFSSHVGCPLFFPPSVSVSTFSPPSFCSSLFSACAASCRFSFLVAVSLCFFFVLCPFIKCFL